MFKFIHSLSFENGSDEEIHLLTKNVHNFILGPYPDGKLILYIGGKPNESENYEILKNLIEIGKEFNSYNTSEKGSIISKDLLSAWEKISKESESKKEDENRGKLKWYFVENKGKHVQQIVIDFPKETEIPSRVNNVIGGDRIQSVRPNGGWASDLLYLYDKESGKALPVHFVNANGAIEMLPKFMKIQHLALSFYKMESGGLFQIFNHVEVPKLEEAFASPFIVESSYWIEEEETKNLIKSFITGENVEMCFVAPGNNGPCTGFYGFKGQISDDCRNELLSLWESLLEYHHSIPTYRRNYQKTLDQYNSENPIKENPILKKPKPIVINSEKPIKENPILKKPKPVVINSEKPKKMKNSTTAELSKYEKFINSDLWIKLKHRYLGKIIGLSIGIYFMIDVILKSETFNFSTFISCLVVGVIGYGIGALIAWIFWRD
jgi:hypothetical protein